MKEHCAHYILPPSRHGTESPLQNEDCQMQQPHTIYWAVYTNAYKGDHYAPLNSGAIQEDHFHSFNSDHSKLLVFFPAIVFCGCISISFTMYA